MKLHHFIAVLLLITSVFSATKLTKAQQKQIFVERFKICYKIRWGVFPHNNRMLGIWGDIKKGGEALLNDAAKGYAHLVGAGIAPKISGKMASDSEIDTIANAVWKHTGGALVDHAADAIGKVGGEAVGGVVGGIIGGAIGFLCPPLEAPLVEAGTFLGKKLGGYLGEKAGDAAADVANKFIENKIIDPASEDVYKKGFQDVMT